MDEYLTDPATGEEISVSPEMHAAHFRALAAAMRHTIEMDRRRIENLAGLPEGILTPPS